MLATTYARLLARTLALSGTQASTTDSADLAQIGTLIDSRCRAAWEHYWWPETMQSEARPYRADYASGTTYAIGDEVYYPTTGYYYTATASTTGNAPTNNSYWELLLDIEPAEVPYTATGLSAIGKVRQVAASDPQDGAGARNLPFALTATGVRLIGQTVPMLAYVWYQLRAPELSGATYSAGATYAVDDRIYFASGSGTYEGDYWTCLTATSAGESPSTHAAKWQRNEIPSILVDAIAYGTAADLMRAGGKADLAPYLEDKAETALIREQSKLMAMQRQTAGSRRSTLNPPALAAPL